MRKLITQRISSNLSSCRACFSIINLFFVLIGAGGGVPVAAYMQDELRVSADFTNKESVVPAEQIGLRLSRPLLPSEGNLAILIGQTDMTSLFTSSEKSLTYSPSALLLPVGENTVTVYLISSTGDWRQIAQFPLRVEDGAPLEQAESTTQPQPSNRRSWFGFDRAEIKPSLTLNVRFQSAVLYYPDSSRPDRINFTDVSVQGSLQSSFSRGNFSSQNRFDLVGVSFRKEALRFGERGLDAPRIDLSNYLVQFQVDRAKILIGHNSYGTNRYLINGFSSRGLNVTVPFGPRADFSFSTMNGTSIIGWNNFFGLNRRKHKITSGTFGYEFLPKRPGGLRVEVGLLHGSLLPLSNYNQSSLTDAETSQGVGARLVASDAGGRFRLDAGYGRSRFGNPTDPLLNQGFNVVAVRETARGARYLDVSYQILRDLTLFRERKINLSLSYRHNRVDPLFRSVAVFTQADRLDNQFELTGNVGDINAALSYNSVDDNLDDIPTILKTLTRRNALQLGVPLPTLFRMPAPVAKWLPRVSYSLDRTHAYGAFLPVNGDFSLTHVPDQLSTNHTANAEWQRERWRFGYRFNQSLQDNRQAGRERADFKTHVHGFTLGVTPHRRFDLNFDVTSERANTFETDRLDRTLRAGFNFNWQTTSKSTLAATVSSIFAGDVARASENRNADLDLQWSWRFGMEKSPYRKYQGQFFVRYANRYTRATDNLFLFRNITKIQTMNAGLSFTFF